MTFQFSFTAKNEYALRTSQRRLHKTRKSRGFCTAVVSSAISRTLHNNCANKSIQAAPSPFAVFFGERYAYKSYCSFTTFKYLFLKIYCVVQCRINGTNMIGLAYVYFVSIYLLIQKILLNAFCSVLIYIKPLHKSFKFIHDSKLTTYYQNQLFIPLFLVFSSSLKNSYLLHRSISLFFVRIKVLFLFSQEKCPI